MAIIDQIKADRTASIKAGDKLTKAALTILLGEIQRKQSSPSEIPSDDDVLAVVKKLIKDINTTIQNRSDLDLDISEQEAERAIYSKFQPQQMSDAEIEAAVVNAIASTGAGTMKEMGKVMGFLSKNHKGLFDGAKAKDIVLSKLQG
ncbi:YqeY-like protein [Vibrio phage 2.275.O._10N.286.54.E11]|nr:YqeY-like protein [Vibrio phage 2.275.O._10N.286.54.E11]